MNAKSDRTLRQQAATVARLANELRFELLLLHRMAPAAPHAPSAGREPTVAEIYAGAVLRAADRDLTP